MRLFSQSVRQISEIRSHTDCRSETVVGIPLQMIEKILWIEVLLRHAAVFLIQKSEVAMGIHHRRHHCLPGEIDPHRAAGSLQFAFSANAREMAVLNDECRI